MFLRILRVLVCSACLCLTCAPASSQTTRQATNLAAILAYPTYYLQRPILLVGKVAQQPNGDLRVSDDSGSLRVIAQGTAPDGLDEVRGEFWDLGRMKADDPRLARYDLRNVFHVDPDGSWPRPGEVTALIASSIGTASPAPGQSIRAVVLDPARYLDQKVTITGQFEGRNMTGDLPDAPGTSRYDFVLKSGDAAIWVSNLRPRGKDANGKDFELGLDARIDLGRWLQVSGTIRHGRGLLWVDGDAGSLKPASASEPVVDEPAVRVPAAPPPEVVFSAPADDETDVSLGTNIRIQFSRDLDPASIKGRVNVAYLESQSVERGEPTTPTAEFTTSYVAATRVLEVTFARPLERFRTVKVQILEGVVGTDQQPLKPWALTFNTGGS